MLQMQPDFQFIRHRDASIRWWRRARACTLHDEKDLESFLELLNQNPEYIFKKVISKDENLFEVFYLRK